MDLLERAPVLDELDGVLATATTGGRIVVLESEAASEAQPSRLDTPGEDRIDDPPAAAGKPGAQPGLWPTVT